MNEQRLAELEAWAKGNKNSFYEGAAAKAVLELVAALREELVAREHWHHSYKAVKAERDALHSTVDQVRELAERYDSPMLRATVGSDPDAGEIRTD